MPEYLAPGVYVEETPSGIKPIEGVSTSTAAFLGPTERGPEMPHMVTSFPEYQRWYGGFLDPAQTFMPHAVKGFFDNGGKRAFIARVASGTAVRAQGTIGDNITISALGPGTWGGRVRFMLRRATYHEDDADDTERQLFRLTVIYLTEQQAAADFVNPLASPDVLQAVSVRATVPEVLEDFDNLTHREGASNNVIKVLNGGSQLVRLWKIDESAPVGPLPSGDLLTNEAATGTVAEDVWAALQDGDDGADLFLEDWQGDLAAPVPEGGEPLGRGKGLRALDLVDEVSILVAPDDVRDGPVPDQVRRQLINSCETLKDRFAVISVNAGEQIAPVQNIRPFRDTSYAAYYHPWIYVFEPFTGRPARIPAAGHIAGVYARTDIDRGVHKAPANEVLVGTLDLGVPVTKGIQDILNPRNVNCLRDFRADGRGFRVWGARTMSSDPEWKYVNVRRLFLFIEESIDEGTQWVVFEPNYEPTWAKVRRNVGNFLLSVWRSGALMGRTPDEAFFVKCDRETMTADDIENGRLICLVGVAPVRPAEFVIFRIFQKTADAT